MKMLTEEYLEREKRRRGEGDDFVGRRNGAEAAVGDFGALDLKADLMDDRDDLRMNL